MNIIIINHYAGSDEYGMEFRPQYMGRELVSQGHDVTVLAASYSHLRKKQPKVDEDFQEEYIDGVRYVFIKTPTYKRNDHKRFINVYCFYNKIKKHAKQIAEKYKPDAVIGSSTYPNDVKLAKIIAGFNNAKIAYEIHDIWPLSLIELYHFSTKNPLIKFLQKAENFAYKNSDVVISILSNAIEHINDLGFKDVNYIHIPNGISDTAEKLECPEKIRETIEDLKSKDKFIVMYLGGFAKANALDEFVMSAKTLPENMHLVLVGDGLLKNELLNTVKENNFTNVSILDSVPKGSVQSVLELSDCLYIGAKKSNLYKYGIGMNKLYDYMLSSKPLICGIEAADNPISLSNCGIVIEPQNVNAISEAIINFCKMDKDMLTEMGKRGYDYVINNHSYSVLAAKFVDALR